MTVTISLPRPAGRVGPLGAPRRGPALAAIAVLVIVADQFTKAWAWRSDDLVHINSGSGLLFGDRAGAVYRDGRWGSLIDVAALALIIAIGIALSRLRLPRVPFTGAALILAGWTSNLGDRIGLHELTAPGSVRGVVDFLRFDGRLWNVADLTIIAGTVLCTVSVTPLARRGRQRAALAGVQPSSSSGTKSIPASARCSGVMAAGAPVKGS